MTNAIPITLQDACFTPRHSRSLLSGIFFQLRAKELGVPNCEFIIVGNVYSQMTRSLRLELPNALYHITSRGDRGEKIYDDEDRLIFLEILLLLWENLRISNSGPDPRCSCSLLWKSKDWSDGEWQQKRWADLLAGGRKKKMNDLSLLCPLLSNAQLDNEERCEWMLI